MIQVRHLNPDDVHQSDLTARLRSWLDESEIGRLQRFVREEDQHSFLVSHGLKRCMLARHLDCDPSELKFGTTGRNKPVILEPRIAHPLHFNLSHTQGLTVMAISREPIGVDAEGLDRQTPGTDLAARYFTPAEQADIALAPETNQRFLTYWTLKEAYLKAEGWGIVDRLDGFEFELSPPTQWPPTRIRLRVRGGIHCPTRAWQFYQWQVAPHHLVSLAACARQALETAVDIAPWANDDWC